jgi:histidinol-phosphate aminotransferase
MSAACVWAVEMKITPPVHIAGLVPYKPGKPIADVMAEYGLTDVIKLASNENPLGASPKALAAAAKALPDINMYPNGGRSIREAIARKYNLPVTQVIAGSGSEGVMNTLMRSFLSVGDEVLTSEGTFTGFYVLANAMGLKTIMAPKKNYGYDLDAIAERITPKTKMIYIANPNNPTGKIVGKAEFEAFYEKVPPNVIIMHDEAYFDFAIDAAPDYYSLLTDIRPNVITLRTFSKSHGLAGIRIGFASAHEDIIATMLKVKLPFEPGTLAQAAGIAALDDEEFVAETVRTNSEGKKYFEKAFAEMGVTFVETWANFFCLPFASAAQAKAIADELEKHGVITRWLGGFGLEHCVRISIGTMEQNKRAIHALREVLGAEQSILNTQHLALST